MTAYSFRETLNYFSEHLQSQLPQGDLEKEGIEIEINSQIVTVLPAHGGIQFEVILGLVLRPIPEKRLRELMTSHFVGVDTGGCTFTLDEEGVSLCLKAQTSPSTPPQENWEWLHRLLNVAREWIKLLSQWEEFIPLFTFREESEESSIGEKV